MSDTDNTSSPAPTRKYEAYAQQADKVLDLLNSFGLGMDKVSKAIKKNSLKKTVLDHMAPHVQKHLQQNQQDEDENNSDSNQTNDNETNVLEPSQ